MTLTDGDYRAVEDAAVATLLADTGAGGLREDSGGGPPVLLIESELRREPRLYRTHEIPAIAVCVLGKDERAGGKTTLKTFRLAFFIYCRGLDVEDEVARCQRIAHRVETVVREQTQTETQFGNLPQNIDGSLGALTVDISRTEFLLGPDVTKGQPEYGVMGMVEATVSIPCAF